MTYNFNALLQEAEKGCATAQQNLGNMYVHGDGVLQDYAKAVHYYTLAADQGDAGAENNLGYMYLHGKGVVQDYVKAEHYYKRSAEQGYVIAQHNLGYIYMEGNDGVPQDYVLVVHYYKLAAHQGDAGAQHNLEIIFVEDEACMQIDSNREMAIKYWLGYGKERKERSDPKLKTCARCKVSRFCSTECMQRTWTYHKPHQYVEKRM